MIKELVDRVTTVALFTSPRRFGKTTAMRMIRAFHEGEASLFEDKKIWAAGDDLKQLARVAREQINGKQYDATFRAEGIADIEKIGLAYCKDKVVLCR